MMMDVFAAFATLLFVLGLFGFMAWGIKRSGLLPGHAPLKGSEKQLDILESKMVDGRNRLVVVAWRGNRYLLGTNPNSIRLLASDNDKDQEGFKKLLTDDQDS